MGAAAAEVSGHGGVDVRVPRQERLAQIEAETKRTGTPVETLCGQAILGLSK